MLSIEMTERRVEARSDYNAEGRKEGSGESLNTGFCGMTLNMGRRTKEGDALNHVLSVKVTSRDFEAVRQWCNREGYDMSTYVRILIRLHLGLSRFAGYEEWLVSEGREKVSDFVRFYLDKSRE